MERRCCNMPYVPFTTYECERVHRQIKCAKLLKILMDYQRTPQGKYLTKLNVRHNLAVFPDMRILQYILATSNFGTKLNPYYMDFDLKCLGSWQNPERFFAQVFNELKNDPFKKIFTPFLNKPFDEYPFTSYGTSLKWPTKGDSQKTEDWSQSLSKFYDDIAGDPENLYSKNATTQTVTKRDDKAITEQEVREAYPFLRNIYSDETLAAKPYDTRERMERARSLFTVYYHTPFDSKNPSQNTMRSAFSDNGDNHPSSSWISNKAKQNRKKRASSAQRKSMASVWQSSKRPSGKKRSI